METQTTKPSSQLETKPYEAVVIMHPDANLEEQKNLFRKNKGIIQEFKGEVLALETWGKRTLANAINKQRKGVYFHMMFQSAPGSIAELERTMRINDKVLRYMHVRLDDRVPLVKHMEKYKKGLAESAQREREREAKIQAKRAAMAAERAERSDS